MRDRIRTFHKLTYYDPREALVRLHAMESDPEWQKQPTKVRTLRTNSLKKLREAREAALFCYGMSQRTGQTILFAPHEAQDHDFIARIDGEEAFFPVQLKSAVTHDGRNCATIEEVLAGVEGKYAPAPTLTIAVYLNQRVRFVPTELTMPQIPVGGLWVFAGISPNASRWALWGNFLRPPAVGSWFMYPTR